jgi:hypothetical protein
MTNTVITGICDSNVGAARPVSWLCGGCRSERYAGADKCRGGDRFNHADDTTVPVLEPGLGKTSTGRLWCYVRDDRPFAGQAPPAVVYCYSPDRKGEHPRTHLGLFRGILQADGYQGYARLYDRGVTEAACMAHARRKFVDVYKSDKSPLANEALQRIAGLYAIEATIRGRTAEARLAVRAEQSAPLFADLKGWMEQTLPRVSGKSDLASAIRYALSRWDALSLVLRDGRVCLDNNAAERPAVNSGRTGKGLPGTAGQQHLTSRTGPSQSLPCHCPYETLYWQLTVNRRAG